MQDVDVSTITDLKELKSLAYDQIHAREVAEKNLQLINARIVHVTQEAAPTPPAADPENPPAES
jgi:hypothetical protein